MSTQPRQSGARPLLMNFTSSQKASEFKEENYEILYDAANQVTYIMGGGGGSSHTRSCRYPHRTDIRTNGGIYTKTDEGERVADD